VLVVWHVLLVRRRGVVPPFADPVSYGARKLERPVDGPSEEVAP
jgi:hypothetical protein